MWFLYAIFPKFALERKILEMKYEFSIKSHKVESL